MITSSYSFFPFILAYDFGQRARRTLIETLKGPSVISIFPLLVSFFLSVNCVWMEPIWWKQDCIISKVITHIYAPAAIVSGVVLCCTHRTCLLIDFCTLLKKSVAKLEIWERSVFPNQRIVENFDLCFQNGWWWSWSSMTELLNFTSRDPSAMTHVFLAVSNLRFVLVPEASLMITLIKICNSWRHSKEWSLCFLLFCQLKIAKARNRNTYKQLNIIMLCGNQNFILFY